MGVYHPNRQVRISRRRAYRNTTRQLISIRYPGRTRRTYRRLAAAEMESFALLNALYPEREKKWMSAEQRFSSKRTTTIVLENFSFIDNPTGTFESLALIAREESLAFETSIDFVDPYCLDIGPYMVLGVMREHMIRNCRGGKISRALNKVVSAVGLDSFLQMKLRPSTSKDIWPIKLQRGSSETVVKGATPGVSTRQIVTDRAVEGMNRWLENADLELSPEGCGNVGAMLGEAIDNAERHSGSSSKEAEWFVAGFMARRKDNDGEYRSVCHLGILSLGRTVAQSLSEAPEEVRAFIDGYVGAHHGSHFSKNTLTTVCALQDNVSRDPHPLDSKGGTGFMDVIDFTSFLGIRPDGKTTSNVAIISGDACLIAKYPYANSRKSEENSARYQWFNQNCSLEEAPEKAYVLSTKWDFPGTLISLRFELHEDFLRSLAAENGDDNQS